MSATLADFCLRPDETNFSERLASPARSPAKHYRQSRRDRREPTPRREPMYADVVDVLATDAAGRK